MFTKLFLAAFVLKALLVSADPNPIVPGPGDSYKEGSTCPIQWDLDTTGQWTNMKIDLKTGDNFNMVLVEEVTTIDATKKGSYSYPCPVVNPNSAIYFYEFSCNASTVKYWTTRFTITDQDGKSVPPPQNTQPDGSNIPWGTGALIAAGNNSTSPAPSSDPSSLPSSSSGLPSGGSSISSSSRLSSTRSPTPTQSGNSTSSQSGSNGDAAVAISKTLVFAIGLVASATFFL